MGPAAPRGWGAVALVFVAILVVTLGGWFVAGAVPGEPTASGRDAVTHVDVGPNVTVAIAPGWSVVREDPSGSGVVLSNGTGLLEVYPAPGPYDDATALLSDYVAEVLRPAASQVTISDPERTGIRPSDAGVRARYQGTFPAFGYPLEGVVTAVVAPGGSAVIFDGSAPQGQLLTVADELDAMIAGSEIR